MPFVVECHRVDKKPGVGCHLLDVDGFAGSVGQGAFYDDIVSVAACRQQQERCGYDEDLFHVDLWF